MKPTHKLLIFIIPFLALATTTHAQSPLEQLNQMVQQLQKNPSDNALREKILKLGTRIRPAPALPDEAVRYTGRAMFVFKTAKSEADYLDAAREYERAVASAPWVASYYADLCTIYEKAGKYAEAKRACDFALVGTTDSSQAIELKQRIAGLEVGIERNSTGAQAQRKQEEFAVFLRSIEGAVFQSNVVNGWTERTTVENGILRRSVFNTDGDTHNTAQVKPVGFVTHVTYVTDTPEKCNSNGLCPFTITLSPDGQTITESSYFRYGKRVNQAQVTVLRRVN